MQARMLAIVERARYVSYGLAAGILIGIVLGWMFHGAVRTILWVLLVLVILAPLVAAVIFWQRISTRNRVERVGRDDAGESVVIQDGRRIREVGSLDDDASVRDAEWRERQ